MSFQCFLFMCHAGCTALYRSRSSIPYSGGILTAMRGSVADRGMNMNTLPPMRNTTQSSPNGMSSVAKGSDKAYSLASSIFMIPLNSGYKNKDYINMLINNFLIFAHVIIV